MTRVRASVRAAAVVLAAGILLAGCSDEYNDARGMGDAPVRGRAGEDSAAEVYDFPDGFGNLATKCVGDGERGYATTRFERSEDQNETVVVPANAVIVADPECSTP